MCGKPALKGGYPPTHPIEGARALPACSRLIRLSPPRRQPWRRALELREHEAASPLPQRPCG